MAILRLPARLQEGVGDVGEKGKGRREKGEGGAGGEERGGGKGKGIERAGGVGNWEKSMEEPKYERVLNDIG